jgi:hypothetical protein
MKSKLFGQATKSVVNLLATQDVTVNFHHQCATPEKFTAHGLFIYLFNSYNELPPLSGDVTAQGYTIFDDIVIHNE